MPRVSPSGTGLSSCPPPPTSQHPRGLWALAASPWALRAAAPSTHQPSQSPQHSLHLPAVSSKDLNASPRTLLSAQEQSGGVGLNDL